MLFSSAVLAYIDPVSGSILLQVIVAGIIGSLAFFHRRIVQAFRAVFGRRRSGHDSSKAEPPR